MPIWGLETSQTGGSVLPFQALRDHYGRGGLRACSGSNPKGVGDLACLRFSNSPITSREGRMRSLFLALVFALSCGASSSALAGLSGVTINSQDPDCINDPPPKVIPPELSTYMRLHQLKLDKSTFETTDQWQTRITDSLAASPQTGDVYVSIPMLFMATYDADEQAMELGGTLTTALMMREQLTSPIGEQTYSTIPAKKVTSGEHRYIAHNALNASVVVTSSDTVSFVFGIPELSLYQEWNLKIPMSPKTAQGMGRYKNKDFHLILHASIASPYVAEGQAYYTATMNTPIEGARMVKAIILQDKCVYLRNDKSGEILAAFKFPHGN